MTCVVCLQVHRFSSFGKLWSSASFGWTVGRLYDFSSPLNGLVYASTGRCRLLGKLYKTGWHMGLLYTKEDYNLIEIKSGYIYLWNLRQGGGGGLYKLTSPLGVAKKSVWKFSVRHFSLNNHHKKLIKKNKYLLLKVNGFSSLLEMDWKGGGGAEDLWDSCMH